MERGARFGLTPSAGRTAVSGCQRYWVVSVRGKPPNQRFDGSTSSCWGQKTRIGDPLVWLGAALYSSRLYLTCVLRRIIKRPDLDYGLFQSGNCCSSVLRNVLAWASEP